MAKLPLGKIEFGFGRYGRECPICHEGYNMKVDECFHKLVKENEILRKALFGLYERRRKKK